MFMGSFVLRVYRSMIHGTDLSFGPTITKFFNESSETWGLALYAATARQRKPGSRS